MSASITRRTMIEALGAGVTAAAVPPGIPASPADRDLAPTLYLADASIASHHVLALLETMTVQRLEPDLVRQWRDGLGTHILSSPRVHLLLRWDKTLLLADLAREAGRRVRYQEVADGLFRVEIERDG